MKLPSAKANVEAFTLVELLLMIFVVAIFVALLLPLSHVNSKAYSIQCMSNQKQIELGLKMFASDNNEQLPWQVSSTNSGSIEAANRGYAAANFQAFFDYIKNTHTFICPTDKVRSAATNIAQLRNQNISYFIALASGTNAGNNIVTGDRHLKANDKSVMPGLFCYSTNLTMHWTRELHGSAQYAIGFLSFADGHVEGISDADLNSIFLREGLATNRLCIP